MSAFRILLRMHGPIVMPRFAPRLDRCLQEAASRSHRDWSKVHDLPVLSDEATGYRASQLVFATTPTQPLRHSVAAFPDSTMRLDFLNTIDPPRPFRETGGDRPKRLTRYDAIVSPYALFYGEGDGEMAARMLTILDGVGREYANGCGSFEVVEVEPDERQRWRITATRQEAAAPDDLPFDAVGDRQRLEFGGPDEAVWRPPLIVREVLS